MKYKYTYRKVKKRGKKDGRDWQWDPYFPFRRAKDPDPPIDQEEPTEYEKDMLRGANENLSRILHEWHEIDERLTKNCANAEDIYKSAKNAVDKESGEHKEAIENFQRAKEQFYALSMPAISAKLFWFLFIIIGISEFIFNGVVFLVLGQSKIETYLMVAGVVLALLWTAEILGRKLRIEKKSSLDIAIITALGLAGVGIFTVIAMLRGKFFEATRVAEAMGIQWDINSITLIFFIINLGLYVFMAVLGYEAGHKNPSEYRRLKRNFDEATRTLRNEAGDFEEAAEKLANAKIEFNKAHAEREHEFEKFKAEAEKERDIWMWLIQVYRSSNMEARRNKTKPISFKNDPEELVKIPGEFQKLDCGSCCYEEERK
jgi:hypothetical protein